MTFYLEADLAEFHSQWTDTVDAFVHDCDNAALAAAVAGVEAAQADHPYTDRTYQLSGSAHAEPRSGVRSPGAVMIWPADYASYVNNGTERSKPYPFVPRAMEAAEAALFYGISFIEPKA